MRGIFTLTEEGSELAEAVTKKVTYDDLYSIPENMIGEIIAGEIVTTPRPSARHTYASSALGHEVGPPYQLGRGGPGGWVILDETEILLGENLLVPDFAGWRRERFPGLPAENWISVVPDWICEVLSPFTARPDRVRKMPIYAEHGVQHLWLIDPVAKTLEVFRLESGRWVLLSVFAENDSVRAEPFHDIEIELGNLWIE
jgi:Uma2 family endonuclease